MSEIEKLLYRAIKELAYIQELAGECAKKENRSLIASAEGAEIVAQGMALLGVKDLSA